MQIKREHVAWQGYIPAIVTPFHADGALDFGGLSVMLDWLHAEGMHGLVVAGTTGEWTSLSAEERQSLFTAVGRQLGKKLPLIAGCTAFTAPGVLSFANHAASVDFDGILVTPPPYLRPGADEIFDFYAAVAAGSPLPVCVYNWPPGTGIDMSLDLLTRLAAIPNIVAIKQSTSDWQRFLDTFFALNGLVRVFGHTMDERGLALLREHGGDGTMGAGAVLGRIHPDFYNNLWAGDIDAARACGLKDRVIMEAWYTPELVGKFGSGPAILKAGLKARGIPAGHVRAPLHDVSAHDAEQIRHTLVELGVILGHEPQAVA